MVGVYRNILAGSTIQWVCWIIQQWVCANALELHLSCTNPSICISHLQCNPVQLGSAISMIRGKKSSCKTNLNYPKSSDHIMTLIDWLLKSKTAYISNTSLWVIKLLYITYHMDIFGTHLLSLTQLIFHNQPTNHNKSTWLISFQASTTAQTCPLVILSICIENTLVLYSEQ